MTGNKETELSLFDFQTQFSTDEDCLKYLSDLKWSLGFQCKKCKHIRYCKGIKAFDRQCTPM
jgi:hypothetical protein